MSIWKKEFSLQSLKEYAKGALGDSLGICFTEIGEDYLKATMPVDQRTRQPFGILHGGASVVLAETVGSVAGNMAAPEGFRCVGLEVNANHVGSVRSGLVTAIARPFHIGKTTQVWEIKISNDTKNVCISRLTLAVLKV